MPKSLCVYCSSSDRLDPKYYALAEELGRALPPRDWQLVYGGGNVGMMGALAREVKRAGGHVVGVIPAFMQTRELAYDGADELHVVATMRERKGLMETRADAFVALPGGWGTLEEILEIITLRQLDTHRKPCVFLNYEGFYDDLLRLFDRMVREQFNRPSNLRLFTVARSVDEVFAQIAAFRHVEPDAQWYQTR